MMGVKDLEAREKQQERALEATRSLDTIRNLRSDLYWLYFSGSEVKVNPLGNMGPIVNEVAERVFSDHRRTIAALVCALQDQIEEDLEAISAGTVPLEDG